MFDFWWGELLEDRREGAEYGEREGNKKKDCSRDKRKGEEKRQEKRRKERRKGEGIVHVNKRIQNNWEIRKKRSGKNIQKLPSLFLMFYASFLSFFLAYDFYLGDIVFLFLLTIWKPNFIQCTVHLIDTCARLGFTVFILFEMHCMLLTSIQILDPEVTTIVPKIKSEM